MSLDASPRRLLQYYGLKPDKKLGQHFLADAGPVRAAVEAAELGPEDVVLEVGPGLGILTHALSDRAGRVIAVELDARMRKVLADQLGHRANLRVVDADILGVDPADLMGAPAEARGRLAGYKVVANLPYQITSAVLRHLLEARVRPERLVVMVQKEVAERILATPGAMSILAVAVQLYARPSLVQLVPPEAFLPPPNVDSALLRLDVYADLAVPVRDVERFFQVVRAGFGQKRKQLRNSLSAGLSLSTGEATELLLGCGIDPQRRAETLSLEEWAGLAGSL
ncbi:MAG: 16S rRNA (adenine(1518)-N(6)/adenine(1519)-N(6))-dimethyltransferase RsmA [Anaerolineae bacterium]